MHTVEFILNFKHLHLLVRGVAELNMLPSGARETRSANPEDRILRKGFYMIRVLIH